MIAACKRQLCCGSVKKRMDQSAFNREKRKQSQGCQEGRRTEADRWETKEGPHQHTVLDLCNVFNLFLPHFFSLANLSSNNINSRIVRRINDYFYSAFMHIQVHMAKHIGKQHTVALMRIMTKIIIMIKNREGGDLKENCLAVVSTFPLQFFLKM